MAIRVSLETLPPFGMAAVRLVLAGTFIIGVSAARGLPLPTAQEWRGCTLVGALMFVGGNGSVCYAQQSVSSSLVAILVSAVTLWTAILGLIWGIRPTGRQWLGIALGLGGVVALNLGHSMAASPIAAVALLLGSPAWALGSIFGRRLQMPRGTMASGAQMLAGGACLVVVAGLAGEQVATVSTRSALAFVYLLIFGSIVGFTAYGYLLKHAPLHVTTSYAYVNPLVAVLLGLGFGGESLEPQAWGGLGALVIAVGLVTWPERAAPAESAPSTGQPKPTTQPAPR